MERASTSRMTCTSTLTEMLLRMTVGTASIYWYRPQRSEDLLKPSVTLEMSGSRSSASFDPLLVLICDPSLKVKASSS